MNIRPKFYSRMWVWTLAETLVTYPCSSGLTIPLSSYILRSSAFLLTQRCNTLKGCYDQHLLDSMLFLLHILSLPCIHSLLQVNPVSTSSCLQLLVRFFFSLKSSSLQCALLNFVRRTLSSDYSIVLLYVGLLLCCWSLFPRQWSKD